MPPMLFCEIGWMETYTGNPADNPRGAGSDPEGRDAEKCNFKPFNGWMLGYVAAVNRTIKITRLGASGDASSCEGVDVVWIADRPDQGGLVVVGWYRDATVFRHLQEHANRGLYQCEAEEANCVLLEPASRDFKIEKHDENGSKKGHPGQSNVWFGNSPYGKKLKRKLEKLINQEFDKEQLNAKASQLAGTFKSPPRGIKKPSRATHIVYGRDPCVSGYVLQRAKGLCELCKKPAPFMRYSNNTPFLEIHHVKRLADGGADVCRNAVALCPNCHREAHHGIKWKEIGKKLKRVASRS